MKVLILGESSADYYIFNLQIYIASISKYINRLTVICTFFLHEQIFILVYANIDTIKLL